MSSRVYGELALAGVLRHASSAEWFVSPGGHCYGPLACLLSIVRTVYFCFVSPPRNIGTNDKHYAYDLTSQ